MTRIFFKKLFKNWLKTKTFCKNRSFTKIRGSSKKFKTLLNKNANGKADMTANIIKHALRSKSSYVYVKVFMILRQCLGN